MTLVSECSTLLVWIIGLDFQDSYQGRPFGRAEPVKAYPDTNPVLPSPANI